MKHLLAVCILFFSFHVFAEETQTQMQKNFEALIKLQEYAADPKAFSNPANREDIQKHLDSINVHMFPKKLESTEPGLAAIASLFEAYVNDTREAFRSGAAGSFVRNQVRTMSGFCFQCHTRMEGSKFQDPKKRIESLNVSNYNKALFLAATRQFDVAIKLFEKIIASTPNGELGMIELTNAARHVLSITVRVKQDPKETMKFLKKLSNRKDLPDFFVRSLSEWKKDVQGWQREKQKPSSLSESQLFALAKKTYAAGTKKQIFPADPSGDVSFLRTTNYIHQALAKNPKSKNRAEALYILGSCYDALQDPMLWGLDSMYFEACVREFPHSKTAKNCYERYAAKLYFGFTGSSGTFVPEDEQKKLKELRKLAE
ncbi:MAG: hypothetical protein AB7F43_03555 [Bacteriovoracia bacterium]